MTESTFFPWTRYNATSLMIMLQATIIYYCRTAVLAAWGSRVQRINRRSQASPTTPTSHVQTVSSSPSGKTSPIFLFSIFYLRYYYYFLNFSSEHRQRYFNLETHRVLADCYMIQIYAKNTIIYSSKSYKWLGMSYCFLMRYFFNQQLP